MHHLISPEKFNPKTVAFLSSAQIRCPAINYMGQAGMESQLYFNIDFIYWLKKMGASKVRILKITNSLSGQTNIQAFRLFLP